MTIKERWLDPFLNFLNQCEYYGNIGHSELLGFYVDGDGEFRPHFTIDGMPIHQYIELNDLSKYLAKEKEVKVFYYDCE